MNLHLAEMAAAVAPGAHAVLLLDQAGWHLSDRLAVPPNITLMPLPAKCPELNPVENVWQFIRDNWLSNRIFHSEHDIVDHCCHAWNKLVEHPWRIAFKNRDPSWPICRRAIPTSNSRPANQICSRRFNPHPRTGLTIRIPDLGTVVAEHAPFQARRHYRIDRSHRTGSPARRRPVGGVGITLARPGKPVSPRPLSVYQLSGRSSTLSFPPLAPLRHLPQRRRPQFKRRLNRRQFQPQLLNYDHP